MNKENIENDIAQLRAEKSETLARDAGGALAAAPCSAWSEQTHENGLITFAGQGFGGCSADKEKIAWLKEFMES
jgi:hypothetical protein